MHALSRYFSDDRANEKPRKPKRTMTGTSCRNSVKPISSGLRLRLLHEPCLPNPHLPMDFYPLPRFVLRVPSLHDETEALRMPDQTSHMSVASLNIDLFTLSKKLCHANRLFLSFDRNHGGLSKLKRAIGPLFHDFRNENSLWAVPRTQVAPQDSSYHPSPNNLCGHRTQPHPPRQVRH